uniref:Uncharacterized protein n=1 Tax=Oryza punctata TaxID=4537 RepID=A0A0E0JMU9_ORYPU
MELQASRDLYHLLADVGRAEAVLANAMAGLHAKTAELDFPCTRRRGARLGGFVTNDITILPPVTEPQLWPTKPPPIPRTRSPATPRAHAATRTTAMAENPLFAEVVAIYDHLVDNPDAAKIVLDAARSDVAQNDAHIAEVEIHLGYVLHRADELMTEPMTEVEREAQRILLEEVYNDLRAHVDFLLERRRQLHQVVNLLLFIRTYDIIKRALRRFLPAAALTFVVGTAAVVVYVEWRRGTVPAFETLGMIFTRPNASHPTTPRTRDHTPERKNPRTPMEDNHLADEVLDSLGLHLFNNVDDIKILLDAARADLAENAAHIAEARARLIHVRRLVGEVATTPMTVEQQHAVRAALEEVLDNFSASSLLLLERRRQLRRLIFMLLLLRSSVFIVRAARLLPTVLLSVTAGSAAVLVLAESRRGVPAFRSLARIFAVVMCGFFECYRTTHLLVQRQEHGTTPKAQEPTRTPMEVNNLAEELLDSLGVYLINNVDDVKILLDAARADLDDNAAHLAKARARLRNVRRLVREVTASPPMIVDGVEQRHAARVTLEKIHDDIRASSLHLRERRQQLHQVVCTLLMIRSYVFVTRAALLLPAVLLSVTPGSAAVVAYAESRRGVPAYRSLARIFALAMCGFFECYRVGLIWPRPRARARRRRVRVVP